MFEKGGERLARNMAGLDNDDMQGESRRILKGGGHC
jgi:hypothetical protein